MKLEVIQGDCLEVLPTLADASVDAVVTDPPYGIHDKMPPQNRPNGKRTLRFAWDTADAVGAACRASMRVLKRPGTAFWFCGWDSAEISRDALREAGMAVRAWSWVKKHPPPAAPGNRWTSGFELASFGFDKGAWFGDSRALRSNVLVADSLRACHKRERCGHPTQKPLSVMLHIVSSLCPPGGTVLDPFCGSGSTGVACAMLRRGFIGIELDPEYCGIAKARIAAAVPVADFFAEAAR